jgi:hypothetical protein
MKLSQLKEIVACMEQLSQAHQVSDPDVSFYEANRETLQMAMDNPHVVFLKMDMTDVQPGSLSTNMVLVDNEQGQYGDFQLPLHVLNSD